MWIYIALIVLLSVIAAIATIWIGHSRQNKEGNPEYEKRTSINMINLTVFYVIAAMIGIALLIYVLVM
jgi:flagellar basal body-associated protein FliL